MNYNTGGQLPDAVVVADLNGDGNPDLVIANSGSSTVAVLLGKGDGTFQAAVNYRRAASTSGRNLISVAAADVNGDNKIDLVVTNSCISSTDCSSGSVGVLLGNGDGSFQPVVVYNSGAPAARSVAIADLNGDGKPDIIVANCGNLAACPRDGFVGVLLGIGDGTFKPVVTYDSGAPQAVSVAVADVNADGKPDILVANTSAGVSVLLGIGDGTFQPATGYASLYAQGLAVADLNHDGKLDVVTANMEAGGCAAGDGSVTVMPGIGNGTFATGASYDSGGCLYIADSVAVADINGDGNPRYSRGQLLRQRRLQYEWHSRRRVAGKRQRYFPAGDHVQHENVIFSLALAVADLNGDGAQDVVVANNVDSVAVLLNVGHPLPTTTTLVSNGSPAPLHKLVSYAATIGTQHGRVATGTVAFQDGGATIASVAVANNQAAYNIRYNTSGNHTITAVYSGDLGNQASSSAPLLQEIRETSKTVLTSSSVTSYILQSVTFIATVTSKFGPIPDGELVTFYDWHIPLVSVPMANGVATYTATFQQAGEYQIKAVYPGDAVYGSTFDGVPQMVKKYPTTTTLASSQNPSKFGQPVTFTVTVSSAGPMPTGAVVIYDGAQVLASLGLTGASAQFTTSSLVVRNHTMYAIYWSDQYNRISRTPYFKQLVEK